jgi:hypothetical protein
VPVPVLVLVPAFSHGIQKGAGMRPPVLRQQPRPPCDSVSANVICPGGVTVFQLTGRGGSSFRGTVLAGSAPPASGPVTVTFHPATDSISVAAGRQAPVSYCGTRAPAGTCGA